jgi:hypothetical protein
MNRETAEMNGGLGTCSAALDFLTKAAGYSIWQNV